MRIARRLAYFVAGLHLLLPAAGVSAQDGFVVIAHPTVATTEIPPEDLSDMFLRRVRRWPDDTEIKPIEPSLHFRTRVLFTRIVHGKTISQLKRYWERQIKTGKGMPPKVASSEPDIVRYVRETAGAIGYVAEDVLLEGVKKVNIAQE